MFRLFADGFRHQAWTNHALLEDGERQWPALPDEDTRFFVRILNHAHVVERIFIGHLTGKPHGFDADNTLATPTVAELRTAIAQADAWLVDYAAGATVGELAREIEFEFTDGDRGCMCAEEILLHLLTHGNIRRGMAERVLAVHGLDRPADTFTHFLHLTNPSRHDGMAASKPPA
ncbi:MAG: DinB family protein [Rhodanobacteraceae bacterium]